MIHSRRRFLKATAGTGLLGSLGEWQALAPFSPATAAEAEVTPEIVRLRPEIEPMVRLIEETPRDKCLEMAIEQLRGGLPYRQFLAALFLAGIRNVNPQPPGFKFHCVFVIHAAHQLSLDAPVGERLLPLFWALDDFKASQQRDVDEGDFHLRPVAGSLPSAASAWQEFDLAMDDWDQERADRAVVALVRSRGAGEVIEGLWRHGARDYRNIGHKAIFVANAWRTLETIGWQHAEPTLRSLVLGLLDFGRDERVNGYAYLDQSYLANVERARQAVGSLPGDWALAREGARGNGDAGLATELLAAIRSGQAHEACQLALDGIVSRNLGAASAWDAVHLAAGDLMMAQPGIYGIHTVTSSNALDYAFRTSGHDETRLLLTLQGIGWMAQFANFMASQPQGLAGTRITGMSAAPIAATPAEAAEQVLSHIDSDRALASAEAFAFAQQWPHDPTLARAAVRLVLHKGTDAHDYKYPAAIFEDCQSISLAWQPHMLATAVYHLPGSEQPDSPLIERARAAIAGI